MWLWRRPASTALIRPLAWEPPHTAGAVLEKYKYIYIYMYIFFIWRNNSCLKVSFFPYYYNYSNSLLITVLMTALYFSIIITSIVSLNLKWFSYREHVLFSWFRFTVITNINLHLKFAISFPYIFHVFVSPYSLLWIK